MRKPFVVALMFMASCSGSGDDTKPAPSTKDPKLVLVPGDGGVSSTAITVPTGVDPSSVHLDDVGPYRPVAPQPRPPRERRPIDVTLRSTPPGATAVVDGTAIGPTPAFWSGYADSTEHTFVFTLPGHTTPIYRFVPVTSGVIHARLEPISVETDAGVAPPPEVVPHPPAAMVPPAPPPTMVTPADAAVAPPPPTQPAPPVATPPTPPPAAPNGSATSPVGPQP